jgi:hypothetical protein
MLIKIQDVTVVLVNKIGDVGDYATLVGAMNAYNGGVLHGLNGDTVIGK